MPAKIDAEVDLHGYTVAFARDHLEAIWSRKAWQGLRRVRIIHGTGEVLYKFVRKWADEKSIPWTLETHNPGVTILQPALRREHAHIPPHLPFARHHETLRRAVRTDNSPTDAVERIGPSSDAAPPAQTQQSADLFAQEMERLRAQDPRSLHKRKHGT